MTIEDIERFMEEHPGEWIPLDGGGSIHPQSAIDILNHDNSEVIDILKGGE